MLSTAAVLLFLMVPCADLALLQYACIAAARPPMGLPASLAPVLRLPLPSLHSWKPRHAKHDGSLQVQVPPCCHSLTAVPCMLS